MLMETPGPPISIKKTESIIESPAPVQHDKRRRIGFLMAGIGAFLCVFGFLITLFLLQHDVDFGLALYGTTGLGGTLLFGGLVAILG